MTAVRLGPGREFDVIRGILTDRAADTSLLQVGPGDDAAVLRTGARVLSTDLSVEDIHFRRSWLEPWEVGYRAAMAALSDLGAMGADPRAILVSLAGTPADAESGFLAEVGRGTERAAREVGAALAGGVGALQVADVEALQPLGGSWQLQRRSELVGGCAGYVLLGLRRVRSA